MSKCSCMQPVPNRLPLIKQNKISLPQPEEVAYDLCRK